MRIFNICFKLLKSVHCTDKCETKLFRPPVRKCNSNIRKSWKSFGIKANNNICISNKALVNYFGVNLDKFLCFNSHINIQPKKARIAIFGYKKFFFSKYIKPEVKTIMYQTLIRPILTYGCQICFNISPSYMEKLRVFERKCLRSWTYLFRMLNSCYDNNSILAPYYTDNEYINLDIDHLWHLFTSIVTVLCKTKREFQFFLSYI